MAGAPAPAAAPQPAKAEQESQSAQAPDRPLVDDTRAGSIFMSVVPLVVRDRAIALAASASDNEQFARSLRVRVNIMSAYKDLGEMSRRTGNGVVNGVFQLTDLSHLDDRARPSALHKQSSFVIDHDAATIATIAKGLTAGGKEPPSPNRIAAFVSEFISEKTYTRGFDIASRVAATHSGDCTEHAVLTAALLRRFGFSARVIFGIVLVGINRPGQEAQLLAVGHAWVEEYDSGQWRIVDAALQPPSGASDPDRAGVPGLADNAHVRLAYLPITVMKDESAGYSRALMNEVGVDTIVRIDVDAVPTAE